MEMLPKIEFGLDLVAHLKNRRLDARYRIGEYGVISD